MTCKFCVRIVENFSIRKILVGRPRRKWEYNNTMDLRDIGVCNEERRWIKLPPGSCSVNGVEPSDTAIIILVSGHLPNIMLLYN
jgi:hypothetical protein